MCEYCKGEKKIIKLTTAYGLDLLDIFIKDNCLWEKTNDFGVEINYCPMCGRILN